MFAIELFIKKLYDISKLNKPVDLQKQYIVNLVISKYKFNEE